MPLQAFVADLEEVRLKRLHCENCFAADENSGVEVDDVAEVVEEIHALHELAFVVVADELDTYAAVDVVLHNLYKLKSKRYSIIDFD